MKHETARQRAVRYKRDPLRAAQIAPRVPLQAPRCSCGHSQMMHDPHCLTYGCACDEYCEVT